MTDRLRWGYLLFPDSPSFRAVAKSTLDISRDTLGAVRGGVLSVARNALAFVLTRPLGATVLITGLWAWTFCAVGYVHYKHAASDERIAALRTERANADLQDALDRLRDELAATKSRIDTPGDNGKGQTAASEQEKSDLIAQFTQGLEQPRDLQVADPRRSTQMVRLSWEPRSIGSVDQNQIKLQQLSAERDEAVSERDQFRARVSELEQTLSLLQSRRGLRPVAKAATVRAAFRGQVSAAAAADASVSPPAADVPAPEHPRQVAVIFPDKNFTPPGWVPTNFSNESAPIRGTTAVVRPKAGAKE
jgi:hypothetical protein